ncbi:hypothetical protein [Chloroflexus aggregans]|uniref:hypothetical protein n=1 Tax=Chloroflexus aggregans TaxID=152260 RepID=UPI000312ABA1|nr:hypothetical protein [Chloroflexus aggregans]
MFVPLLPSVDTLICMVRADLYNLMHNAARLYRYMMVEIGDSFRLHDVLHAGEKILFSRHDLPYL